MKIMNLLQLASIPRTFRLAYTMRQAGLAHAAGHVLSFDYIPKPITCRSELMKQLALLGPQMHQLGSLFPQSHWSMKPDLWGLLHDIDLLADSIDRLHHMCHQAGLQLRVDTPQNNSQAQCLPIVLKYTDVQPVLAVNAGDFTQAFKLCMQHACTPRLVKGNNIKDANKYTETEQIIQIAQHLWKAGHSAAIATHDVKLLETLVQLPDFDSHRFEVEMVAQLAPSSLPEAISAPMLRLYFPFGPGCSRFFARRLHLSLNNRRSVINAVNGSLRRQ